MNAAAQTRDFLRVALLAKEATGMIAVRANSTHDGTGLWHLRDAANESICEVAPDGTVVELHAEAALLGLLDRIRDLRHLGIAPGAIYGWFRVPQAEDRLPEAQMVFRIAMEPFTEEDAEAGGRAPARPRPSG